MHSDGTAPDTRDEMIWKTEKKPEQQRKPIARADLEQTLTEAVRTSHPEFETFIGVIVERTAPASAGGANWTIRGVKYGKANRDRSGAVLSHCVEEAQQEFVLSD
jgi:hypothetical protein